MKPLSSFIACCLCLLPFAASAQDRHLEMVGAVPASAYSSAVKVKSGSYVFLSLMEPTDSAGKLVAPGDFGGQSRQIWKNMEAALKAAGGTMDDVVSMTVFTTERRWADQFTDLRREVFKKGFPASAFMEAAKLPTPGAFVAVRAIAVVPQ